MADDKHDRDRVAYLRLLAVESLNNYSGGFSELNRVDRDLKWTIGSLAEVADPSWTAALIGHWGSLEVVYATALAHNRSDLTENEEVEVRESIAKLLAELERYKLELIPGVRPRERDIVRLLRPLVEHGLEAGVTGTVVADYGEYSPATFLVEFADSQGVTQALVDVLRADLEVVWRLGYSNPPSSE